MQTSKTAAPLRDFNDAFEATVPQAPQRLRHAQALLRGVRLQLHLFKGWWTVIRRFPKCNATQKEQHIRRWANETLALLAVEVEVHGQAPQQGPLVLAANHISWLDVLVLLAIVPARFVAKAEVARWPVIGTLTRAAGTVFITRHSRRDALRVVQHLSETLGTDQGNVLVIFPEGTTSDGRQLLPFHPGLFDAAIRAAAPLQTLAIRFEDASSSRICLAPCYIDDDTLVQSLWRTLTAAPLRAVLRFGPAQRCEGHTRQTLATQARAQVQDLLAHPHNH